MERDYTKLYQHLLRLCQRGGSIHEMGFLPERPLDNQAEPMKEERILEDPRTRQGVEQTRSVPGICSFHQRLAALVPGYVVSHPKQDCIIQGRKPCLRVSCLKAPLAAPQVQPGTDQCRSGIC